MTEDISGNAGYNLDWFTMVERTITLAWRRRDPRSACTLVNTRPRQHLQPKNIEWKVSEGDEALVTSFAGEVWLPMLRARAWHCSAVPCNTAAYKISSMSRLRNPRGEVT